MQSTSNAAERVRPTPSASTNPGKAFASTRPWYAPPVLYRLLRPLLYLLPAESAHHLVVFLLRVAQATPGLRWLLGRFFGVPPGLEVDTLGLTFPNPVGLAAGFDKNAEVFPGLLSLGFGSVEVGTLTGVGQPGNPRPRLFRLREDRALINRMGFNNKGSELAARFLERNAPRKGQGILGINIGKSKLASSDEAVADYEKSAALLGPYADYLVVNVSSPNTPGLRDLQAVESLRPILLRVRATLDRVSSERRVPLLVKIAPDLSDEDILAVAELALELKLDGIVATNTTISRAGLRSSTGQINACGAGGLSGAPLKSRALEVLGLLYRRTQGRLTLVSVGGIESADDAWQRLLHGASLLQVYSAMIYEGPGLPSTLARGLARQLASSGFLRVSDAVGSAIDVAYDRRA